MDQNSFVVIRKRNSSHFPVAHVFKTVKLQIEEDMRNAQLNPLRAVK
jgi:hypothetical protein